MSTSAVPAVLDALVALFADTLPDVEVIDGPWVTLPQGDYLTVGWTPYDNDTAADALQEWRGFRGGSPPPRKEEFDVVCYLDSAGGDTDAASVKTRRDGAFVLLADVEDALRNDLTLGGAVSADGWVELKAHTLHQVQAKGAGYAVGITFHVTGTARI